MVSIKGGLGRGLDHIFNSDVEEVTKSESENIKYIEIDKLKASPYQPRKNFSEESLEELATSISNQGIISPLIVRIDGNMYEIIAGERRFRAAKIANLSELPVIVRDYTNLDAITIALVENLQRENLNPIEEAEAFSSLKDMHKLSQEELAGKLGKSRSAVANSLRLLNLPEYIKHAVIYGEIKSAHARCLITISNESDQKILFDFIVFNDLNVREVENIAEIWRQENRLPDFIYDNGLNVKKNPKNNQKNNPEKNEFLSQAESKLQKVFAEKVLIRGNENKGNIKFTYKNNEELQNLINVFSLLDKNSE